ncbi:MAG: hypothetical protein HY073_03040 [Deltaproteobacteria bacterium]|nr:hypothetical protein [Deltaproteobacteria bacterium]
MSINKDFEDLLHHLNSARAEYMVVGAYAVIFHTEPRYTKDLDIWIRPERENAEKVYEALKRFGAPLKGLSLNDLMNPKMVYQIGIEPNRIDILMGVGKLPFDKAWEKRVTDHYGKERIWVLGFEETIQTKKIAGRTKDKMDLEVLLKVAKRKKRRKLVE